MNEENKIRSNVQDMVKGALIIAVVFFHSTLFDNVVSFKEFNILFCIFPCILGVFIFYAGYNYKIGKRKPIDSIKRRTKQLIIPLLIMIVVDIILVGGLQLIYGATDFTGIWHAIKKFLVSEGGVVYWNPDVSKANYDLHLPITCLWYLYTLYIVSIVFYLIVDKIIIKLSRFLLLVSALLILSFITGQFIGHTLPYAIQSLPLMLAIMLTGAFFAKRKELDRPIENAKTKNIIIILTIAGEGIVFGVSMLCYFAFQAPMVGALAAGAFNDVIKGFDAFITFIMTISGTFFIHNLMRLLSKVKFLSIFFGFFGKRVALLYVTHPIFLSYIHTIIFGRDYHVLGKFQPYAYMLLTLILFTGISLLISLITKKKSTKIVSEVGNEN